MLGVLLHWRAVSIAAVLLFPAIYLGSSWQVQRLKASAAGLERDRASLTPNDRHLNVATSLATENVAYVLADPGQGDMDGDGSPFDGSNRSGVRFEHPTRSGSRQYDDAVHVARFADLWEAMSCTGMVSAASRAHPHAESTLALFRQSMRDYRDQLDIGIEMAEADRLQEISSIAAAAAGVANAAAALPTGVAQALNTFGAMSGSAVAAGIALGLNIAATVKAGVDLAIGEVNRNYLNTQRSDLSSKIDALDTLHQSVRDRAFETDARAFSDR